MNIFKRLSATKEKLDIPVYTPTDQKALFEETYELGKTIGQGSFATVYKVTRRSDNEQFACKILDFIKNSSTLKHEILILSTLRHESICGMIEFFLIDDKIYLILDYCSGGELFDRIIKVYRVSNSYK
jgi:serine/threonine protein kinase